ncbi:hypothetical protein BJV78DRAFT_1174965 [Lactifluus subvellereus]|nr:hypothetical protein BJV78DRAFT_1174965 [Lactifluus subvellereus]
METHDPKIPERFVCPHSSCKRPFRRKNDLKRHCISKHSDLASTSLDDDPSWVSGPAVAVISSGVNTQS